MTEKINYKQAAELLGVPIGTLYAWVCRNQIPHHRYGRRLIRFDKVELEAWMAQHHVPVVDSDFRIAGNQ
jgi:excisionase family DNA binding protein